ncbi:kinase-like protein [Anaeromyces robustus]|uniref:Kinase-like protein n=1 Tax=Anaeromyces robustus TaxID=1754192 RepID=A0A1Y1X9D7_9FUNG|nr:kinase-like protein [Anaeromyces robustus]|eukprot:ORX82370.1 kinase-like protein [Anaeromyces robustus]
MSIFSKGSSKKFNINSKELFDIVKDHTTYFNYEDKLNTLESKLLFELKKNEEFKEGFDATVINIVEIIEDEKLKGFINGETCHCTSITIKLLEDGIDMLFNEDFNNTISQPVSSNEELTTSITISSPEEEKENEIIKEESASSVGELTGFNNKQVIINNLISHENLLTRYPPSGSTLDDYEIIEALGQGAFGFVRRAKKKSTGEEVIIKFIVRSNILRSSWMRDNNTLIPSEIHILLYLTKYYPFEGIQRILDYWQDEIYYYFVMDSDHDIDLFEYIDNFEIDIPTAREIFLQVVKIVHHLHSHGIVHMDIKDENIIINKETKKVKLIDFGSSSYYEDGKIFKYFVSSGDYSAPETFTNKYEGPPQDIWSLGVLLYTIVFKRVPFEVKPSTTTTTNLLPTSCSSQRISSGSSSGKRKSITMNYNEISFPENFEENNPELYELIKLMLNKDYKKRPNIKVVLEHPWLNPKN